MDKTRLIEILKNKNICEVYYEKKPIWIQEVHDNTAKIGFVDGSKEKNVFIEDLYENLTY